MHCTFPACLPISAAGATKRCRSSSGVSQARPDQADWYSNLGIVLQSVGLLADAIGAYRQAIALHPGHANAHNNLGVLLRAQGDDQEAEDAYRAAIRLNPGHPDAYHNLAILLSATGRTSEAVTCYCTALTLRPHFPEARRLLALAYCVIGQPEKAVLMCEAWLQSEPDDPLARHTLAAVSGRDVPARASDEYVREDVRQLRGELRGQAREAPLSCAGAGGGSTDRRGHLAGTYPRHPRCRMRHRTVRPAVRALRASPGRRRSVGGDAGSREGQTGLRRTGQGGADSVPAGSPRRVRSDRDGRHARVLRCTRARRGCRGWRTYDTADD